MVGFKTVLKILKKLGHEDNIVVSNVKIKEILEMLCIKFPEIIGFKKRL